jgi:hypothetical protein
METIQYAAKLERKLVEEFKALFREKVGYTPLVFTKHDKDAAEIPLMSLEELDQHFQRFLPVKFGDRVPLQTKRRMREIVELRSIFCHLAKNMKYSLCTIGTHLGGRDHTTVIHGLRIFRDLMDTNDSFRQKFLMIHKHIKENTKSQNYESSALEPMSSAQCDTEPSVSDQLLLF